MLNYLERAELIVKAEKDERIRAAIMEMCSRDVVFWINHFCFGFDPRRAGKKKSEQIEEASFVEEPFCLYPFQEWAVRQWYDCILEQEDFVIEKSRDQGVSFLVCMIFLHMWLFVPGVTFLLGSRSEDYVDAKDSMNSLFGKLRFMIRKLPWWMVPAGYKEGKHAPFMSISNPANKNKITGEAPTQNFGRGGRVTAIFLDELAFWPFPELAWTSTSQTTGCRIVNSTPFGAHNTFALLANDPENQLIAYPFEDHEKLKRAVLAEQKLQKAA
jgi:hypothetical protein